MSRHLPRVNSLLPGGVWSAAPTPFTGRMEVDLESVRRMVDHHLRLGVKGLFLCGTNGEGPWMTNAQKRRFVGAVIKRAHGRLPVAVQVTDNSAARIMDNIGMAREEGADIAVVAPPYFLANVSPETIRTLYLDVIRRSPLPVGIYDRGKSSSVVVPESVLRDIYSEPNVVVIKDSSADPARMRIALAAKRKNPALCLLNGWEFNCIPYLQAGFDGLLLGGGVFNGYLAGHLVAAVQAGNLKRAAQFQAGMNRMMWAVYGGRKITCWLAGEKQLLVRMGIFKTWRNYPGYALTCACRRAIERTLKRDKEWLLP
ncbi:MAG: dihydrodipicolinate synthase family protein [Kiritimatiellae bacterium]|nr:dihydrodipicolinate synthase family protein [Kiritimatiellia bacterium]